MLASTENVDQFNELMKTGVYSGRNRRNNWHPEEYTKAKNALSETGDGLGIGFIKHFMPSPPRDETLQNVIVSYYSSRRKAAADKREA